MDIKRDPAILKRKRIRQGIIWSFVGIGVIVTSVAVSRLKPAAPTVPATNLWYGTVKRGNMTREVKGAGTLVPEEIRWIPATTSGRVEKILLRPGAPVVRGTVIMELSNPDLRQLANNAELQFRSGEAQLVNLRATMKNTRAQQTAAVSNAKSSHDVALAKYEADKKLADEGLVSPIALRQDLAAVEQAKNQWDLAQQQLDIAKENEESQLAPQIAQVNQLKAAWDQVKRQLEDLRVKSPMKGVLQLIAQNVQEGQQVGAGANLARVADPTKLKAEIRISETQTKDLLIGQSATVSRVDGGNGSVKGHVTRIDPSSTGGTVGVDVSFDENLPAGARSDLSVDGTIQLQLLENILFVEHPAFGQENSTVGLFKVLPNSGETAVPDKQEAGHEAMQTPVKFGKSSVAYIEVLEGLREGDHVVLSDMSQYDSHPRIKLGG
jgi:HlyD family secretion protein